MKKDPAKHDMIVSEWKYMKLMNVTYKKIYKKSEKKEEEYFG
jgi:hypothetical protein